MIRLILWLLDFKSYGPINHADLKSKLWSIHTQDAKLMSRVVSENSNCRRDSIQLNSAVADSWVAAQPG